MMMYVCMYVCMYIGSRSLAVSVSLSVSVYIRYMYILYTFMRIMSANMISSPIEKGTQHRREDHTGCCL